MGKNQPFWQKILPKTAKTLLPKCLSLVFSAALLQLLGFVFRIGMLKYAGETATALYQLVMNAYAVLMAFSLQGVTLAVTRTSASYFAKNQTAALHPLRKKAFLLFLLLFSLPALLILCFPSLVSATFLGDGRTKQALLLLLLCIFLTGFENIQKSIFLGGAKVIYCSISEVGELVIRILTLFLILPLNKTGNPAIGAALIILTMIAGECFSVFFLGGLFARRIQKAPKVKGAFSIKPLLATAIPVSFSSVANKLLFSLDNLLIPSLLMLGGAGGSEALSGYALLFSVALPTVLLPSCLIIPVSGLVLPHVAGKKAKEETADCKRKAAKLLQLVGLAAIPYMLFVSVFATPVCSFLYGSTAAAPYIPLLALSVLFEYYEIAAANLLNGLGKTFPAAASIVVEGAVLLLFTLLLLPGMGLFGFCVAKFASTFLASLINFIALKKSLPIRFRLFNWVGRPLLASLFALFPLFCLFPHLPQTPLFLLLTAIFYCLFYGLCLRLLRTDWLSYFQTHFWESAA